jgi:GMP synthase-like glutamine amidotransferase
VRILVLQHIACEPPGEYEDVLREHGAELVRVELDEGEALPDWRDVDAIVCMGGPMDAFEEALHPWLVVEKRLIADAVGAGKPFWGVCLGAQLLAAALGARVHAEDQPEIGVMPIALTAAAASDPITAGLPKSLPAFHWHSCTFDLPTGGALLASSAAYRHQIFRVADRAYGLQCHLEVSAGLVEEWLTVPAYAESLERSLGPGTAERIIADLAASETSIRALARTLFERWLRTYVQSPSSSG